MANALEVRAVLGFVADAKEAPPAEAVVACCLGESQRHRCVSGGPIALLARRFPFRLLLRIRAGPSCRYKCKILRLRREERRKERCGEFMKKETTKDQSTKFAGVERLSGVSVIIHVVQYMFGTYSIRLVLAAAGAHFDPEINVLRSVNRGEGQLIGRDPHNRPIMLVL